MGDLADDERARPEPRRTAEMTGSAPTVPASSGVFDADPYAAFRADGHVVASAGGQRFVLAVNYDEVRRIARDWERFTSDTPFEVPIPHERDARTVRQLPIECDPPTHSTLRAIVDPLFSRRAVEQHAERVGDVVQTAVQRGIDNGRLDVIEDLAMPTVNVALGAVLGRPPEDVELWKRWGSHVFRGAPDGAKAANDELDSYLERVVDEARRDGDDGFFGRLATSHVDGRPLTRDEMIGFGNLIFAGGRDTVIAAIATSFVVLASAPGTLSWIRTDVGAARSAVEEILRILSPLPYIGRHTTQPSAVGDAHVGVGELVGLGFAAANRDPLVFEHPDDCVLGRRPNRHITFGHGPHTYLGANLARMELRVTLERTADLVDVVELVEAPTTRSLEIAGRQVATGFERVMVALEPRSVGAPP